MPACGRWWGIDPLAYTGTPVQVGLPQEERLANRPMDIVHVYHRNGDLFPSAAERGLALDPVHPRLLLINWKPSTTMTWAAVAAGRVDSRIDQLAAYILHTFPYRFFLTIWHEPENDVVATPGSGMTAADYAQMYRHVVLRLRADGVTKAITVMDYMGFDNWAQPSWFSQLWPGNDVVDWIGIDPYGTGAASGWSARDFKTLVNRPSGSFPGFYTWAIQTHPGKPMMLAEWGVHYDPTNPTGQATFFNSVSAQISAFPNIKALVYFDAPLLPSGEGSPTSITNPAAVTAWRSLGRNGSIVAPQVVY
ncbi:MAG: hypothetical protein J2P16_00455 [Mycobacterium sp.]|nr:hypothetical protein [Mycobacterium sp.]